MVQDYLQFLPDEPGMVTLIVAMIGTVFGAAVWLLGTKFSRPMVTLLAVMVGALMGLHLPDWFGWSVSGAGPAVGAAVVLGVSGFVLHRLWVGIGLGLVMAAWAAFIVWISLHDGRAWVWPVYDPSQTPLAYFKLMWENMPPSVARIMPFACASALVSGVAAAILWPKLTTVLSWSSAGTTLLAAMGLATMAYGRPELLDRVPTQTWMQALTLAALVAIGATIQWRLSPAGAAPADKPKSPKKDE